MITIKRLDNSILFQSIHNTYKEALEEAIYSKIDCSTLDLPGVNLTMAELFGANLPKANFTMANLAMANFFGANLSGVDFSKANLFRANLFEANLSGANFSGANLSGAILPNGKVFEDYLKNALEEKYNDLRGKTKVFPAWGNLDLIHHSKPALW